MGQGEITTIKTFFWTVDRNRRVWYIKEPRDHKLFLAIIVITGNMQKANGFVSNFLSSKLFLALWLHNF